MMKFFQFLDPFLQTLPEQSLAEIESRRVHWNINQKEFYEALDGWFSNFKLRDKSLALKILFNIQFYSESDFNKRMGQLWSEVERYLAETNTPRSNVVLVVPTDRGDSSDRHAYTALKTLDLAQSQVSEIEKLDRFSKRETVLVFLNDTHGTGTQFVREFRNSMKFDEFKCVFVLGLVYSKRALRRFEKELKGVVVVSGGPSVSADSVLSGEEWQRVKRLGNQVYPKHPVGFGDAGLLAAYHFQCPNNTIPLVWADGKNNMSEGTAYPWNPLFPYKAKSKSAGDIQVRRDTFTPTTFELTDLAWEVSAAEKAELENMAAMLYSPFGPNRPNVSKWLHNFSDDEKDLALALLRSHVHWDVSKTRLAIRQLRDLVANELARTGGEMDDVIIVTTGSERPSTYHYVFEFIREWQLEASQVVDIKQLNANRALDKHLVFFYHTRSPGREFFEPKAGTKSYLQAAVEAKPISTLLCAFAEAPGFQAIFEEETRGVGNIQRLAIDEASRPVKVALGKHYDQYKTLLDSILGDDFAPSPDQHLSVSYYFKCPKITSPLFWFEGEGRNGEIWNPLFRR